MADRIEPRNGANGGYPLSVRTKNEEMNVEAVADESNDTTD